MPHSTCALLLYATLGSLALQASAQPCGANAQNTISTDRPQITSVYFCRQQTLPWNAYLQYSGSFPERGSPQHIIDFGTAYTLSPHQQLDFHWSFGLSAVAPDHSIGIGYSVRFQVIHPR